MSQLRMRRVTGMSHTESIIRLFLCRNLYLPQRMSLNSEVVCSALETLFTNSASEQSRDIFTVVMKLSRNTRFTVAKQRFLPTAINKAGTAANKAMMTRETLPACVEDGTEAKNEAKTYVTDKERNRYYSKFMTELRTEGGAGLTKMNSY